MSDANSSRYLGARASAQTLEKHLIGSSLNNLTIADAASRSGLALHEAENGLHYLVSEYRGNLKVTTTGELLFDFPHGFTKPWEKMDQLKKMGQAVKKFALGTAKFIVRAWISIVLVAYVAIFALILLALAFGKNSDRDDSSNSGGLGNSLMLHMLIRTILDSLFWTFHPFSPFSVNYANPYSSGYSRTPKMPFYEKVNRFFFGPEPPPVDPLEKNRRILAAILSNQGRIGLFDVMRVTGLSKEDADPLMAKLLLDYDGDVKVSEEGGISYHFPNIRKTYGNQEVKPPDPVWYKRLLVPPMTGNPPGSNLLIAGLNGFNWIMSLMAIQGGWTIDKIRYIFTAGAFKAQHGFLPPLPPEGAPWVLGYIPLIFSTFLFSLPLVRILGRKRKRLVIERENGRRGLLRAVVTSVSPQGIPEETLKRSWEEMAQRAPTDRELVREIIHLGGVLETDESGRNFYRFPDLDAETKALINARRSASSSERQVGSVVYTSGL